MYRKLEIPIKYNGVYETGDAYREYLFIKNLVIKVRIIKTH